jgi:PAS domain S-box-containing protein
MSTRAKRPRKAGDAPKIPDQLLKQKQHLEPLLAISPSAIVLSDLDSNVVAWNPAAEELFGYTAEEAVGRNLDDLVALTEELHRAAVDYSQRARGNEQIRTITRRTRKDGTLVDVEVRAAPLVADGETIGTFGIYHDVTELKRQQRFFEALLEVSPEAIVTTAADDIVTSWNPAAERLFGYTAGDAIGVNIDDLVTRGEAQRTEGQQLSRTAMHAGTEHMVTQRTRKDGSLVDVDIVGGPVHVGDELLGKHVFYHDVTELQRQKRYYEALVELSPTAITTVDADDILTSWNPAAERLFGYTAQEAVGRHINDLVANSDEVRAEGTELDQRVAEGQVRVITRRTRKDGSLVDVELAGAPIYLGDELVGKYALYHDISDLQQERLYYQSVVELSPTAIVTVDDENHVTRWNPAAERLFGYSSEEALGRDLDGLVGLEEEIREEAAAFTEEMARGEHVRAITRRTRKDGSLIDVEMLGAPVLINGERVGHSVIYHDIGEIQRQTRYYEALLEASPTAVIAVDTANKVTSWNPSAERLFGYTAEEAIGRDVDDLVANNDEIHQEATELGRRSMREEAHLTTRRTRKDGSLVDVDVTAAPIVVGGELVGVYGLFHDVSELQRQKRYYEALFESNPVAIALQDLEGNVTAWNPTAEELFGYTAAEAVGRHIDSLVATSDEVRDEAETLTREGMQGTRHHIITRRNRKDGSFIDVDLLGASVIVGGETVGLYAMYNDITELQRQRRYYEGLLETSPIAIMTVDLATTVTSWNPAAERMLGYSAEEAIGRNIDELVANTEELREEAVAVSEKARQGGQVHLVTHRTRKDGSLIDVDVVAAPIFIGGETVGFYTMYTDIGELQRQKRYYESLFEFSPVAVALLDLQYNVTSWNPTAEELFGYSAEEAIGRNIDDLVASSDEIRAEAQALTPVGIAGRVNHLITRRTRKDGSFVDVEMFASAVSVAGETVGFYAMYHNIGELQRQRRYYQQLVDASPVAVVLVESDSFTITSWNPAAERLFGYTAEEAIGQDMRDLVAPPEELRGEMTELGAQLLRGQAIHAVTRRPRKDGSLVDVELLAVPVIQGGERVGDYVLYHDISELQQARREAEAATRAKSAFLATMSHEIRTPLNAVIGMTGLLLDTDLAPEQRSYGEIIRTSGDALLMVINEILDFSKIEAGRLDLEHHPFRLRQCVESALELVATAAAGKSLDLAYLIDPRTPASIVGDYTRLRQILLNLLNNAVKFTERGEVVLRVDAAPLGRADHGGGSTHEIHFAVRDTGIGIPEDRLERLFEAFTQVDASTTRRYGGTGLGLAITKRLAEEMGGRVWVESLAGEGSTFHVMIKTQAAAGALVDEELGTVPELGGKRVLIVDDNATNREILRRQAESWGMLTQEAATPNEALEYVRRGDPFDLAILDMQMPEMDGVALAHEIRQHPVGRTLPLVMLTSLGRREALSEGADFAAYLTKPIRPSQLYDALVEIFVPRMVPHLVSAPQPASKPSTAEHPHLRILLAEDNAVNQRVAILLLEKLGYRADVAADGREALQALERQQYDVVLMDVQMPEMDGLEATRNILERWPGPDRPRIIAMTAGATEADREACLAAGMDDYVSKPIRTEELAEALARSATRDNGRSTEAEAAPTQTSSGVIDQEALGRLRETVGGDEALEDVMGTFLEDTENILAALRDDIESGRAAEVRRHAHSLKSSAASFGASRLSDLSRALEDMGKNERLDGASSLVDQMAEEFDRVRDVLRPGPGS